jgi:Mg2+/Co2+ transporter CorB
MMSLNRYRLKHMKKNGHKGAIRASNLLKRTDQLIGVILIGNNFVNIFASSIATIIAIRLWGDAGIAIATMALTVVILIFAEVTPKTLAALYPEKVAYPASFLLIPLLKLLYPFVWCVNLITNGILRLIGVRNKGNTQDHLSREELRTLVNEAGALIPKKHQDMLVGILDLEKVTVDDIMIPRNEIVGIDINDDIDTIISQIRASQHTRLPVYKGDINDVIGILHLRNLSKFFTSEEKNKAALVKECREPYFIPEGTPLNTQLINFQKHKRRIGIVVDEYGEIQGIATLEDILEEIVGEFTTDYASNNMDIIKQDDGTHLINGTTNIRTINKSLHWSLPLNGPKTLNGLITEYLETIPEQNLCLVLHGHRFEIKQVKDNIIKTVQVLPNDSTPGEKQP